MNTRITIAAAALAAGVFGANATSAANPSDTAMGSYIHVMSDPVRLVDTRVGDELPVVVAPGVAGRPRWASAAIVNVAVVDAAAPGFVTLWDCVGEPPLAAHLNYDVGPATSSVAFAPLGPAGELCAFVVGDPDVDLVIDVQAWSATDTFYVTP